jgi:hypothetical protein
VAGNHLVGVAKPGLDAGHGDLSTLSTAAGFLPVALGADCSVSP